MWIRNPRRTERRRAKGSLCPRPTSDGLVILSATVTPNGDFGIAEFDPERRREQYRGAIAFWILALRGTPFRLAVVETSGEPAGALGLSHERDVTGTADFYAFVPDRAVVARGKGAIEAAAIEYVIDLCRGSLSDSATLYKCTGRLKLINYRACLGVLDPGAVCARMTIDRSYADTRLIGASIDVWRDSLRGMAEEVDDANGVFLEHVVASRIARGVALRRVTLTRFAERPIFEGSSGTSGSRYSPRREEAVNATLGRLEEMLSRFAARKQV